VANLTLNVSGVSSQGVAGSLIMPVFAMALPVPTLSISGQGAIPLVNVGLPAPQLAATGAQGAIASVALTLPMPILQTPGVSLALPMPRLAASAIVGPVATVALTLPSPVLAINAPNAARLTLPTPQLAASGSTGAVASVALALPSAQLVSAGDVPYTASVALALPVPTIEIDAKAAGLAASTMYLGRLALAAQGVTGTIGSVAVVLPVVHISASGYQATVGSVALRLPALQLMTIGGNASSGTGTGTSAANTVVMHSESQALSTYSNFPFNSYAAFNGVFLAADGNGIFALTGDTDDGTLIQANARVGITDFNTSHLKRVDRIYVGYQTTGDLVLKIFTDGGVERDYALRSNQFPGLHSNAARLGKGLISRYWQFEIANVNGANFTLNELELKPIVLSRRVGGPDA